MFIGINYDTNDKIRLNKEEVQNMIILGYPGEGKSYILKHFIEDLPTTEDMSTLQLMVVAIKPENYKKYVRNETICNYIDNEEDYIKSVKQLYSSYLNRKSNNDNDNSDVIFVIDDFGMVCHLKEENKLINKMMKDSFKYNIYFFIAGQFFSSIKSIHKNTSTLLCFQTAKGDYDKFMGIDFKYDFDKFGVMYLKKTNRVIKVKRNELFRLTK